MRIKKTILGLVALASAATLAACASGTSNASSSTNAALQAAAHTTSAPATTNTTTPAAPSTTTSTSSPSTTATSPPKTTQTSSTPMQPQSTKAPAVPAGVPCTITTGACLDLSTHKAWILQNGRIVYGPVGAEPGSRSFPTPVGNFHVLSKERVHYSHEFNNAPMPYSVFFYPGDAFHEGSLSIPSHGCVHLSWTAAETFYNDLSVGEAVQIVR